MNTDTFSKKMNEMKKLDEQINEYRGRIAPLATKKNELEKKRDAIKQEVERAIKLENKELVEQMENEGADPVCVEFDNKTNERRVFEDDGTLHVVIGQIRGCFISNQDITRGEWKKEAMPILKTFGFKWADLNY